MDRTRLVCQLAGLLVLGCICFPGVARAGAGLSPASLNFGSVTVNTSSAAATVMVTNNGSGNLILDRITCSSPDFVITAPALPLTLASHQSTSIQVVFHPVSASKFTGKLTVVTGKRSGNSSSISVSGTGTAPALTYLLSSSVGSVSFGNLLVGSSASQAVTLTNAGTGSVTVSQVSAAGTGFSVSGFTGTLSLAAGQSLSLAVNFAPASPGSVAGSVSIASTATNSPTVISLSGAGVQPLLSVSPASLSFGNLLVGASSSQSVTIQNSGTATLTLTQASLSGSGYSLSGLALPLSLAPGASAAFNISFSPASAGSLAGSLSLASNAPSSPKSIPLSGTGIAKVLTLSASPAALNFGNLSTGTSSSQNITVTNTGNSAVTISQIAASGTGFSISGVTLPITLAVAQSTSFSVTCAPASTGNLTGTVSVVSTATNSPTTIALSAAGVQPLLSVVPSSVSFGNVSVGVTNSQTITLQNPGTAALTLTQANLSGSGYSLSGLTLPLSVAPGASAAFNISFAPASAGSLAGSLSLVSNAPSSPTSVPLSGTGVAQVVTLSANPASLSFGSLPTGSAASLNVTLTNTGNSTVTISQITASGTGFSATGVSLPISLSAGQSTSFSVTCAPASAGSLTGGVTVTSNATNSPLVVSLSATATAPATYAVNLSWTPSSSSYSGFNVYRGTVSGGPYSKIDASLISTPAYMDGNVTAGQTYYYVATEVDSGGNESAYSGEVSAVIP